MDSQQSQHVVTPAGTRVNIIVLAFTLVAGLVVFLRMFTRLFMTKRAGFEDASIALAMIASIVLAITISDQANHGLGQHSNLLDNDDNERLLKAFWASVWVYNLVLILVKVSILVQYLRIFPVTWFRKACFGMLVFVIAYGGWAVFSSIFICYPVPFTWNKNIVNGYCLNQMIVWFTNAGMNIGEDVAILLLPMPVIQTLHMPRGQKQGLIIMLLLGASVTVISIVRLYSLDNISNSLDVSYDNVAHATLSAVEVNVGIICACLPAMRPLFALIVPKYFSSTPDYSNPEIVDIEKKHLRTPSSSSGKTTGQSTPRPSRQGTPRTGTPHEVPRPTVSRTSTGHFAVNSTARPHTPRTPHQSSGKHSRNGSNTSIQSGRFPVSAGSRPHTPRQNGLNMFNPASVNPAHVIKHSRSASNMTADQSSRFALSSSSRPHTPRQNTIKHARSASNMSVDIGLTKMQPARFQGRLDPLRMSPVSPPTAMRFSSNSPFMHPRSLAEVHGHVRSSSVPPRMPGSTKPLPVTPFPDVL